MKKDVIEASHAIAEAVKLVKPGVVAAYPITPQTHIVERISEFVANGELKSEYIRVESEFSAISACLGASATGVRTYTSTSAQGLALMFEILYIVAGMRLPVCMTVANRAMSAPINIWNDHQDSIGVRDCGWIQFYAETAQEAFDLTIMQYKISEDKRVLTPSMVCIDGFTLSHLYEPVAMPSEEEIDAFLPEYTPYHAILDPEEPLTLGPIGFPSHYMELKKTQVDAIDNSINVIKEVFHEFSKKFKVEIPGNRPENYDVIESYKLDDAEIAFVALGSICGTIKEFVDDLRKSDEKVGLLKVICYRPFPMEDILNSLKNVEKIIVLEKTVSPGAEPPLYTELRSLFYEALEKPEIRGFIVGLGGKDVNFEKIKKIYDMVKKGKGKKVEWVF